MIEINGSISHVPLLEIISIVKHSSSYPEATYWFSTIPIKIAMTFFLKNANNTNINMEWQKTQNYQNNHERKYLKKKVGGITFPWLQTILQSYCYQNSIALAPRNRHIGQLKWNRDLIYNPITYNQSPNLKNKGYMMEKIDSSINASYTTHTPHAPIVNIQQRKQEYTMQKRQILLYSAEKNWTIIYRIMRLEHFPTS